MRPAHDQFDDSIGKHSAEACCDNNRFKPEQPIVAKQSVVAVQHAFLSQLLCQTARKIFTIFVNSFLKLPHIFYVYYVICHKKLD